MCVGVTVTLAPPTALACGYVLWNSGQNTILSILRKPNRKSKFDSESPPPQSFISYGIGIVTLSGSYLALDHMIQRWESKKYSNSNMSGAATTAPQQQKHFLPHKTPSAAFRPPQTVHELLERLGPPLLSRLGAASFSFFCAGAVQTYVAAVLNG